MMRKYAGLVTRPAASLFPRDARAPDLWQAQVAMSSGKVAECIADAIDARAGDTAARKRLEGEPGGPMPLECLLLLADLEAPAARPALLARRLFPDDPGAPGVDLAIRATWATPDTPPVTDAPDLWITLLLSEAAGGEVSFPAGLVLPGRALLALVNPLAAIEDVLPGVEAAVVASVSSAAEPSDRARLARGLVSSRLAEFEAAAGEPDRARERVDAALGDLEALVGAEGAGSGEQRPSPGGAAAIPDLAWLEGHLRGLQAALALDAGDVEGARRLRRAWSRRQPGNELDALLAFREARDVTGLRREFVSWGMAHEGELVPWALMARGDGAALVAWLQRRDAELGAFLRVGAPLLRAGQPELRAWLRYGRRPLRWTASLRELLVEAATLKAAAAAAGDADRARQHGDRAARFREALLRRDVAVPLALVERL
ncbi:uncharacterized protein SOCE26_017430 [Sorangium cellulosum]|uniref:Uncharacterized protein n=1 Tax=Sorangium cellulosum TaxID=56 RepID=A0A2L0EM17_SORCE|nr:hypothetical protein [Sorangium cellulosum]AUX40343.1 uncharacterized protein SOCE26_017430 [Sorangium cellulosum]